MERRERWAPMIGGTVRGPIISHCRRRPTGCAAVGLSRAEPRSARGTRGIQSHIRSQILNKAGAAERSTRKGDGKPASREQRSGARGVDGRAAAAQSEDGPAVANAQRPRPASWVFPPFFAPMWARASIRPPFLFPDALLAPRNFGDVTVILAPAVMFLALAFMADRRAGSLATAAGAGAVAAPAGSAAPATARREVGVLQQKKD